MPTTSRRDVKDADGNELDVAYYRYYTGQAGGYVHGLKYNFNTESFHVCKPPFRIPPSAPDSRVAPYADLHFGTTREPPAPLSRTVHKCTSEPAA